MKIFFDTSTLVAVLVREHPHHSRCEPWYRRVRQGRLQASICAHTLAELYATLTVLPMRPLPSPAEVREVLRRSVEPFFEIAGLATADYVEALERVSGRLLRSGAIYDALIAVAAERLSATRLVTLNSGDFRRLIPEDGRDWVLDPRDEAPPEE